MPYKDADKKAAHGEQLLQNWNFWKSPVDAILTFTKLTTTNVQ